LFHYNVDDISSFRKSQLLSETNLQDVAEVESRKFLVVKPKIEQRQFLGWCINLKFRDALRADFYRH